MEQKKFDASRLYVQVFVEVRFSSQCLALREFRLPVFSTISLAVASRSPLRADMMWADLSPDRSNVQDAQVDDRRSLLCAGGETDAGWIAGLQVRSAADASKISDAKLAYAQGEARIRRARTERSWVCPPLKRPVIA